MDWIVAIGASWLHTSAWVVALSLLFGVLAWLTPCNPGMYWWKDLRAARTDLFYWFVAPIALSVLRQTMILAPILLLFGGRDPDVLPVKGLPWPAQCLLILLIQDVFLYAAHRAFHGRLGWGFHAVHHSPEVLDWTATVRFHPVNNLLEFALADAGAYLLGFPHEAIVALVPFNVVYSAMVHANLNWTFGPFRYLLASPVFHRWHHTCQEEGIDKNFAPTFPFLDLLGGTLYMPAGQVPERFGAGDPDFPAGFWGQLAYPFAGRWARPVAAGVITASLLTACAAGWVYVGRTTGVEAAPARAEPPAEPNGPLLAVGTSPILCVALGGDGPGLLAVTGSEDGTVKVFDGVTRPCKFILPGHERAVRGVAVSADGRTVVSGGFDRTVRVWDAQSGGEKFALTGHKSYVLAVAVSADGSRIVSAGADGSVLLWDGGCGRLLTTLSRDPGAVPSVAVSEDGTRAVSASWNAAKLWDVTAGREERTLAGHENLVYGVALSADGRTVVTGGFDNRVKVWDAVTGRERASLSGHSGPVYAVAVSADGSCVASGSKDATVKVWDVEGGRERHTFSGHKDSVTGVAVSADGSRVVSSSQDGTLRVWTVPAAGVRRQTVRR